MIISKTNEYIKHVKSLSEKKYRDEYEEYVVEGIKLVNEAIEEKLNIKKILICKELCIKEFDFENIEYVSEQVFKYISDTETPQGVMAIIEKKKFNGEYGKIVFALDNLSDPGNLGTIIRTLDSAGINSLILSKGSADLYNPKVVRSTMGAIFRIDAEYTENLQSKLLNLKEQGYKIIVTSLQSDKYIYDLPFKEKCVVVIGNESKGVSEKIMELADIKTKIPMLGRTESLNAAVAASIMAYEAVRQNFVG
mgnify:FL=1